MQSHRSHNSRNVAWRRHATRAACLLAAALSLGGCIVYPAGPGYGPHWRPWPGYYYYR
jgi:hypothetical protein